MNRSISGCSPYVYVTYANPNDFKARTDRGPQFNPFDANTMGFTSPEALMENIERLRLAISYKLLHSVSISTNILEHSI